MTRPRSHLHLAEPTARPTSALTCQATLRGPQDTAVRVLIPVAGGTDPVLAVRLGPLALLIADQQALQDVKSGLDRALSMAESAFGPEPPPGAQGRRQDASPKAPEHTGGFRGAK